MIIVDSHCDSIYEMARRKRPLLTPYNFSQQHPQLQFAALFCPRGNSTARQCYLRTKCHLAVFQLEMAVEEAHMKQVRTYGELERVLREGKHALLLSMEGGDCLMGRETVLQEFYEAGVRVLGLAWESNELAKSNRLCPGERDTGLTDLGKQMVAVGNRLGLLFDASHLSEQGVFDLLSLSQKPVIATHSNFRTLCDHSRNLSDTMARAIVEQDGMIGLNLCPSFLHTVPKKQTVARLFQHLDHCLEVLGEDHVGLGCDIDGIDRYPAPLICERSIHDQLIEHMEKHGYTEEQIEKVAGKNYLNFLKKYL